MEIDRLGPELQLLRLVSASSKAGEPIVGRRHPERLATSRTLRS